MTNISKNDKRILTVAIVGFGTVGKSVAKVLCSSLHSNLHLTHIFNRNIESKRSNWVPEEVVWTENIKEVLDSDVDIVVELIGGIEPASDWIRQALMNQKSVVTANKQLIANCGAELEVLAEKKKQKLYFEAAVAGGVPIIRGLKEGLAGDRIFQILGILNGTSNYILTRMEIDQVAFDVAVQEAKDLGYAESDPTSDVDGYDAQAKLAILSAVGLRRAINVEQIYLKTITALEPFDFVYARHLNCTIRQIAKVELVNSNKHQIIASVQPTLVRRTSELAAVEGSRNIVLAKGEFGGETAFSGNGAGGNPTAVAVVSDLDAITREGTALSTSLLPPMPDIEVLSGTISPQYVRFIVSDRPGIIADLANVFSRYNLNIDSIIQEPGWSKDELPFVVTLEPCNSEVLNQALNESASFDFQVKPPLGIPILT